MPGIRGDDEEQPARRRAFGKVLADGLTCRPNLMHGVSTYREG